MGVEPRPVRKWTKSDNFCLHPEHLGLIDHTNSCLGSWLRRYKSPLKVKIGVWRLQNRQLHTQTHVEMIVYNKLVSYFAVKVAEPLFDISRTKYNKYSPLLTSTSSNTIFYWERCQLDDLPPNGPTPGRHCQKMNWTLWKIPFPLPLGNHFSCPHFTSIRVYVIHCRLNRCTQLSTYVLINIYIANTKWQHFHLFNNNC